MTSPTSDRREAPVATGVASGNLGTGTAVTDETTVIEVPAAADPVAAPDPVAAADPVAAPDPVAAVPPSAVPIAASTATVARRRDPYRPIGIALAAVLVALAGVAVLSGGGDAPLDVGAPSSSSGTLAPTAPTDHGGAGGAEDGDDGGGDGQRGNCNGRGNDPCDRDD
jgi:pyruvate dehydrogenase E2 component (dihydrolipoamide acetyltransferase)